MRPRRRDGGSTLVEMIVALMIIAVAAVSVSSVYVTVSGGNSRLRMRQQAGLQANRAMESLKNYVTADHSDATKPFAPFGCWDFVDPALGCPPGSWALDPGDHDISSQLPAELQSQPVGMRLRYNVTALPGGENRITTSVTWNLQ